MTTGDGVSTLEHLAEMDRLLRDIQLELGTGREPAPALSSLPPAAPPPQPTTAAPTQPANPEPAPAPGRAIHPDPDLQDLTRLTARLLASMRELLDGYEQVLVPPRSRDPLRTARPRSAAGPRPSTTTRHGDHGVTVNAGPFASVEALQAFEASVARLPGVRDVAVRGYEGSDRAIIEVRLDHTSP